MCDNVKIYVYPVHLSSLITLQNLVTIFSCRVPVCTHAGPKNVGDARTIGADADMKLGAYAKRRKFVSRMPQFCVVLPQMRGAAGAQHQSQWETLKLKNNISETILLGEQKG